MWTRIPRQLLSSKETSGNAWPWWKLLCTAKSNRLLTIFNLVFYNSETSGFKWCFSWCPNHLNGWSLLAMKPYFVSQKNYILTLRNLFIRPPSSSLSVLQTLSAVFSRSSLAMMLNVPCQVCDQAADSKSTILSKCVFQSWCVTTVFAFMALSTLEGLIGCMGRAFIRKYDVR